MKCNYALFFLVLGTASAATSCFLDEAKCSDNECCVQIGSTPFGTCKPHHEIGETCEMKPMHHLLKKHVYRIMCPCGEGLECHAKEGIVGKVFGTCQLSTETEPED
ncbi:hypothetical protein O988_03538 [Pseudogymnoascus sp. VKM F-3808]|nr:hypothetical protein O988_03538 [Pseudogymnoascus sp. VKM F-3808]